MFYEETQHPLTIMTPSRIFFFGLIVIGIALFLWLEIPILKSDTIPQDQIGTKFWLRAPGWIIPIVLGILVQVFDVFLPHFSIMDTSTVLFLLLLFVAGAIGLGALLLKKQDKETAEWLFKAATALGGFAFGLEVGGRLQPKTRAGSVAKKKTVNNDKKSS